MVYQVFLYFKYWLSEIIFVYEFSIIFFQDGDGVWFERLFRDVFFIFDSDMFGYYQKFFLSFRCFLDWLGSCFCERVVIMDQVFFIYDVNFLRFILGDGGVYVYGFLEYLRDRCLISGFNGYVFIKYGNLFLGILGKLIRRLSRIFSG